MKRKTLRTLVFIFCLCLLTTTASFAQQSIKGKILNFSDRKPISSVSIALARQRRGYTSDKEGYFEIPAKYVGKNDTLVISSIGFQTVKIPVSNAVSQDEFWLAEDAKTLDEVTIKNYVNEAIQGSAVENTAFFRSWTTRKDGGEIGTPIYVNSDDYFIERVRLKLNSQCDTCILRLHIREMRTGIPGQDLLRDSISVIATRHGYDDKYVEFNLRPYNLVVKNNRNVFVSLETLNCFSRMGSCSLAYIGTEEGKYIYRNKEHEDWQESKENSLYLKMYYRY